MVNIKTVAMLAGVSPSTVSRVLSGKAYVNEATRARVQEAVDRTGYSPNVLAKGLKLGSSNTIALMIPSIENPIFPLIIRGVEDTARQCGFTVVLCNTDEDAAVEQAYINKLRTRWIDGFIVASVRRGASHIYRLHREGMPLVLVNRYLPEDTTIDVVTVDNYNAARAAVEHLLSTGCRRVAIALGKEEHVFYVDRYRGYRDALLAAGITPEERLVLRETPEKTFYQLTRELIQGGDTPNAVFATSDPKGVEVLHALYDAGLRVPEDVCVMGFDDISVAAMLQPSLSTVAQPFYEMGATAANRLIAQIRYKEQNEALPPPVRQVLPTRLMLRGSTR